MVQLRVPFTPDPEKESRMGTMAHHLPKTIPVLLFFLFFIFLAAFASPVFAQSGTGIIPTPEGSASTPHPPNEVSIVPTARDEEISKRLKRILESTGWFQAPEVEVKDGVVFLTGQTKSTDYKNWAGDLAQNTQDVVAVVNKISLIQPSFWDLQPAFAGLRDLWGNILQSIPLILFSFLVLVVTWIVIRVSMTATRASLRRYLKNPLLNNVAAYTFGIIIFVIGIYIILQVAGLTNVAATVVGGTGLLGLVLGIAFRDISENFLASIFLSVQDPFHTNDLVEINGILGFVQALTIRVTVLMTLDGTIVQIPNATVYKSNIYNYTSNPNRRADFIIGIDYAESISDVQQIALKVLEDHPAVLLEPEPLILVESLGSSSVNLHVYFWLDVNQNSWLKVKSSVIRLVKHAFLSAGISMPDDAREVIFPQGIPIQWTPTDSGSQITATPPVSARRPQLPENPEPNSTNAEGELRSEARDIQIQARHARMPEDGENLLKSSD